MAHSRNSKEAAKTEQVGSRFGRMIKKSGISSCRAQQAILSFTALDRKLLESFKQKNDVPSFMFYKDHLGNGEEIARGKGEKVKTK